MTSGETPERIPWADWCEACDFRLYCRPRESHTDAVSVIEDPGIVEALREVEHLRDTHRRYEQARKSVTKYLKERIDGEAICGPYHVAVKERARKSYVVKDSTYKTVEITRWKEDE